MGWNYVATFTGTWSIANFPTGAVDESGTLWVMYGDEGKNQALTYFSHPLPQNGASFRVDPIPLAQRTTGSPCLMRVRGQLLPMWVEAERPQWLAWGVLDPETRSLSQKGLLGYTPDGALAAFFPKTDCLLATYRGVNKAGSSQEDGRLNSATVTGLGTPEPLTYNGTYPLLSGQNINNSYYSPAVAAMPNGDVAVLFKGVGRPGAANSDDKLYFMSAMWAPDPLNTNFSVARPVQYPGHGGTSATAVSMNRPGLALHGTGLAATLVALYPGTVAGQLSYLVGTLNGGGVTWAAPPPNGTVPLDGLLANAGAGGGAVTLTNPVGVWVTASEASETLYLLVGDQVDGHIKGPLYVVRYMGENS